MPSNAAYRGNTGSSVLAWVIWAIASSWRPKSDRTCANAKCPCAEFGFSTTARVASFSALVQFQSYQIRLNERDACASDSDGSISKALIAAAFAGGRQSFDGISALMASDRNASAIPK